MDDRERLRESCRGLVKTARRLKDDFDACYQYTWFRFSPFNPDYARWKKEVRDTFVRAFGANSARVTELDRCERVYARSAPGTLFDRYLEELKSAEAALERPPAAPPSAPPPSATDRVSFRTVSRDLLSRAAALRDEGNYLSSAVMCGAVLENALRHLAEAGGLRATGRPADLSALCGQLLSRGALDSEEHRQLLLKFSLKKLAEHCYSDKLNAGNVGEMLDWTGAFLDRRFH